jgi:hypothetical protein
MPKEFFIGKRGSQIYVLDISAGFKGISLCPTHIFTYPKSVAGYITEEREKDETSFTLAIPTGQETFKVTIEREDGEAENVTLEKLSPKDVKELEKELWAADQKRPFLGLTLNEVVGLILVGTSKPGKEKTPYIRVGNGSESDLVEMASALAFHYPEATSAEEIFRLIRTSLDEDMTHLHFTPNLTVHALSPAQIKLIKHHLEKFF